MGKNHDPNHRRGQRGWMTGRPGDVHTTSETAVVKAVSAKVRKLMRQGPAAVRSVHPWRNGSVKGRNAVDVYDVGIALGIDMWDRSGIRRRLYRRIMKKAGQPYRKNHNRKRMRRRASGKNEVTR